MKHAAFICSACVVLLGAGQAFGQERTRETTTTRTRTTERFGTVIMGSSVMLQGNVAFGKVYDFVITEDGCIEYIVLLEQNNYVFVPWAAVQFNVEQRIVTVNVTREKLREVTFTKDKWPSTADAQFRQKVQTVFGDVRRGGTERGREADRQPPPDRRDRVEPPKRSEPPKKNELPKKDG
jgi:PRC-barrel domain protein